MKLKSLIAASLIMIAGAIKAKADVGVYDIFNDSITINAVSISSAANNGTRQVFEATLVGATTSFLTVMENRKALALQNLHATADVFCQVALSSTSANGNLSLSAPSALSTTSGLMVPHGGGLVYLALPAREQSSSRLFVPWCVNNSGSGSTTLVVIQGRNK